MTICISTNIRFSLAGQDQIEAVLLVLAEKYQGLHFYYESGNYCIAFDNASLEYGRNDLNAFIQEVQDHLATTSQKGVVLTGINRFVFLPPAVSLNQVLMLKHQTLMRNNTDKIQSRLSQMMQMRLQAIEKRYQQQYENFAQKKKEEMDSQQGRMGGIVSTFSQFSLSQRHPIASLPGGTLTYSSPSEGMQNAREKIQEQHQAQRIESELRRKKESLDQQSAVMQEQTRYHFWKMSQDYKAGKLNPDSVQEAWSDYFNVPPYAGHALDVELSENAEKEQPARASIPAVTLTLVSTTPVTLIDYNCRHGNLVKDASLTLDNILPTLFKNPVSCELTYDTNTHNAFTIKFLGVTVSANSKDNFMREIQKGLFLAGLEQAYQVIQVVYAVKPQPKQAIVAKVSEMPSPIRPNGEIVSKLIKLAGTNARQFGSFLTAMKFKEYGLALRHACASADNSGMQLVKLMLENKECFNFNLNEKAGVQKHTALHQAAIHGNKEIYDYLLQQGADPTLEDSNHMTAAQYLEKLDQSFRCG